MDKKDRIKEGKNTWLRRLPLLGMLALMLFVGFRVRGVTVEDVLNYTPKNLWAASAAMLAAYAVEPLLIIFPVMVLYFATGLILPPLWAVTVGGLGIFISTSVPYVIGRFSCTDIVTRLIQKHPKLEQVRDVNRDNDILLAYTLRVLGFVPEDLASLFMGSIRMKYASFVLGSFIGMLPGMLTATLVGYQVSSEFSAAMLMGIAALNVASFVCAYFINKRSKRSRK